MSKNWEYDHCPHETGLLPEELLDHLLMQRGYTTAEERQRFLSPRLQHLQDPLRIPDMRRAVERVEKALRDGERILVYGDYDVDGMTSSALMFRFLRHLGGRVRVFLPDRMTEGYGLSASGVARALEGGEISLLLALDCGTTSVEEIAKLRARKIDVIVIDHHQLPEKYPDANALVNPQRGEYDRILATVGLTFKFCHALCKLRRNPGLFDLKGHLDLVALGTVTDLVPLEDDNRIMVHHGLRRLRQTRNVGLRELMRSAGMKKRPTPSTLGFVLGPRLNASGRISEAMLGWELLVTESARKASKISETLDSLNKQRQKLEQDAVDEAEAILSESFSEDDDMCIVVGSKGWHQGVVGIVASRLLKTYYRPTIVISIDENGKGKGSGRSIEGCSLMDALRNSREHLVQFGGHSMAAGLEIREEEIEGLRGSLNQWFRRMNEADQFKERLLIDLDLDITQLTEELAFDIAQMEPFGQHNPAPIVAVHNLSMVGQPRVFGRRHMKFWVEGQDCEFECVAFGFAEKERPKAPFSMAGHWEVDAYTGRPCFRLIDWQESSRALQAKG